MYSALIEIVEFGWFDFTVTVSFEFLIGAAVEIDAVQVACGPVPVVTVPAAFAVVATDRVVVAVAALVVATVNVVTAFVDDGPGAVVCVDGRVVAIVGDVLDGLARLPPQPVNPAANATEIPTNQRLRAYN